MPDVSFAVFPGAQGEEADRFRLSAALVACGRAKSTEVKRELRARERADVDMTGEREEGEYGNDEEDKDKAGLGGSSCVGETAFSPESVAEDVAEGAADGVPEENP